MFLRTTHSATVYGERVVGKNEIGQEQRVPDTEVATFTCRFRPQGEGLTREEHSERIDSSPEVVIRSLIRGADGEQVPATDVLNEGQRIDLEGEEQRYILARIHDHYDYGTVNRITLELEAISDE